MAYACYIAILFLAGYAVVAPLSRERSQLEIIGLSLCLGPALVALVLLYASMLGLRPSRPELLIIAAASAVASAFWFFRRTPIPAAVIKRFPHGAKIWPLFCLIAIGYALYCIATDALSTPTIEWDAFAIWQLKAKLLATYALFPKPAYFTNLSLSYSHPRYPLLWPMVSAGMFTAGDRLEDVGKVPSLLFVVGLSLAIYATLRQYRSRAVSIAVVAMLLNSGAMLRYAGCGTAEMAFTALYGASLVCVLRFQQRGYVSDVILAALFSATLAWTKNEGLPLVLINFLAILFVSPRPWSTSFRNATIFFAVAFILYLPWIHFSNGLPSTDEDYINRLTPTHMLENLNRLSLILKTFGKEATFNKTGLTYATDYGLFWILPVVLLAVQWKHIADRATLLRAALIVFHLLAYIPPFLVVGTTWNVKELLDVTADRLLLHMAPAGALLIGFLWPAWAEDPLMEVPIWRWIKRSFVAAPKQSTAIQKDAAQ
jgi:succinate dehydrogenase hydrophobic anchor subunit